MIRIVLAAVVLLSTLALRPAIADRIVVLPGPGTPIQDAIDAAAPNDTVSLLIGVYSEHVVITKPIKLRGIRSRSAKADDTTVLSGSCEPGPVVTIAADGVRVQGIQIIGDSEGGIVMENRTRIKLKDVFVAS